jgi:hypothetical protein
MDFVLENPADSFLWRMPFTRSLLEGAPGQDARRLMVKELTTSYCKYGFPYRKNTRFYTTLTNMRLIPECTKDLPCRVSRETGKHRQMLKGASRSVSNRIPSQLVVEVLNSWVAKHANDDTIKAYVFVDPFAGTGSVVETVQENQAAIFGEKSVRVVDNYFGKNEMVRMLNQDMTQWSLLGLTQMGMLVYNLREKELGEKPLELKDCAVLYWLSTECKTYSINALSTHRSNKETDGTNGITPTTDEAKQDDKMNDNLFAELRTLMLTAPLPMEPPSPPPAAAAPPPTS